MDSEILADVMSCLPAPPITTDTDVSLDDYYLLKANGDDDRRVLAANIGQALAAHPGSFTTVRITNLPFADFQEQLDAWFQILAAKNVRSLVIVTEPCYLIPGVACSRVPINLPYDLLRCAQLETLYIGNFNFPNTNAHFPAFTRLRELGLFNSYIMPWNMEAILDRCTELQRLSFVRASNLVVRIRSNSLQIMLAWNSDLGSINIEDAPRLERLILETANRDNVSGEAEHTWMDDVISICKAPALQVLGYFNLGIHKLRVNHVKILPVVDDEATIPRVESVKTLALKMNFHVSSQVDALRSFLICFTNLETLHIKRLGDEVPNYLEEFWQNHFGSIGCVQLHLKTVVFEDFRGGRDEELFAKSILKHAMVLRAMRVAFHQDCDELLVNDVRTTLLSADHTSADAQVVVYKRGAPSAWSFHKASDLSLIDPFDG